MKIDLADPDIETVFAKSQSECINIFPDKPTDSLSGIAKKFGISVGQAPNIFSGHRKTNEKWRRFVTRKIPIPYYAMIGLPLSANFPPTTPSSSTSTATLTKNASMRLKTNTTVSPLYESGKLAAGLNGVEFDPYEEPISMVVVYKPELQGCSKHHLAALRVGGESMEPAIPVGSIVVVDLDDREFIDKKVYCVNFPQAGGDIAAVKGSRNGTGAGLF